MKRFGVIACVLLYAVSSLGVTVRQFYCCGRLESTSFAINSFGKGNHNDNSENKGCCDTRYQSFKVKDNHVPASEVNSPALVASAVHHFYSVLLLPVTSADKAAPTANHSPPPCAGNSIYIAICVFRI
jgi:hypothetical protein